MPATEFAITQLHAAPDLQLFREALTQCQKIQDDWSRQHQPHNLPGDGPLSSMNLEEADPPTLLITAPWDSPAAHGEWIQSEANAACNAALADFVDSSIGLVDFFHMDPAGREEQLRGPFVTEGCFNVCRISVDAAERPRLQQAYDKLEAWVTKAVSRVWAGWRIEKLEGKEDLVVMWSRDIPDEQLDEVLAVPGEKDCRSFSHLV